MENFITYLQSKNYSTTTIKEHQRQVKLFEFWYGDENLQRVEKKDILAYLSYLKDHKNYQTISRNNVLLSLKHYFDFLGDINPCALIKLRGLKKKHLKHLYNNDELCEILDNHYNMFVKNAQEKLTIQTTTDLYQKSYYAQVRNHTMLQIFVYQGINTREILDLQTHDIDLTKATITLKAGSQRGKTRTLPLNASQIGTLIQYISEIRPHFNPKNDTLFLATPQNNNAQKGNIALKKLSENLKQIDKNFSNIAQIRASVITNWINIYGLRKAQYYAGHKSINSTEEYQPNFTENLAEDITKFNPF